jgi:hypothetical protein
LYGVETGHFGKQWIRNTWKILKGGAGARMEQIGWTDRVRNEKVLHRVKEERNILQTVERQKANWIGCILRWNCLLKHAIEGELNRMLDVTVRRVINSDQLLDDLKKKRAYCKLKQIAIYRTV